MEAAQKTQVVDVNEVEGGARRSSGANDCSDEEEEEEEESLSSHSGSTEIVGVSDKVKESSSASEIDLECGLPEIKVHSAIVERDCRICHMSLDAGNQEEGIPIELGCSCKDDLAAAHKHCAEAWFKIKGNKTCEICGSTARNVANANESDSTELSNEESDVTVATAGALPAHPVHDNRSFWHGHRFLNFLLACMVFAFVISWLFHFNMP
ncbi:E3 ubiquitin-protein ligase MARCH8-like [Tripterygium wilfordii]|uniref:E3 ubiquitin-protein ligase MARCH8-like n=1 Tax=Tripterygium wilfordii TaxID=458696 RepID=A0A7J7E1W7_TRIWF|nr:uncharacterized protein LOC119995123 [Tripterygium wilfordii]KAF5752539.1 E3 ubiquitin-protein ligase MARCH8-like [Tripterygium wilfordii]